MCIPSKTEAKYIHMKMLSATGRTTLLVHTFCPPPVFHVVLESLNKVGKFYKVYKANCSTVISLMVQSYNKAPQFSHDWTTIDSQMVALTHMGTPNTRLYYLDCFDLVLHWYLLVWHWYLLHILYVKQIPVPDKSKQPKQKSPVIGVPSCVKACSNMP